MINVKKLIGCLVLSACLVFSASAWNPMVVTGGGGGDACTCSTYPATPAILYDTNNGTNSLYSSGETVYAEGQSFPSGGGGTVCYIGINADDVGTNGTVTIRIAATSDAGTYLEEWTSETIASDGWIYFESIDNPVLTASTTYFIAVDETSGDVGWFTGDSGYAGTAYYAGTGWDLGSEHAGVDQNFKVYYCD